MRTTRTTWAFRSLALAAFLGTFAPSCTCLGPKGGEKIQGTASPATAVTPGGGVSKRADLAPILSWFETAGKDCAWVKGDPIAKTRTVIVTVPEECPNASVAWSPDDARAVLWFPSREPEGVTPRPRLREVTFATGAAEQLDVPSAGALADIAYDPRGALVALTESEIPEKEIESGKATFAGQTYAIPDEMDGLPVLVHAWVRETKGWKRFETKVSDTGWDLATGVRALDVAKTLGARSSETLEAFVAGDPVKDAALEKKLDAAAGPAADDEFSSWYVLDRTLTPVPVYVLAEETEFSILLATIFLAEGETLTRLPGLGIAAADPVTVQLRGNWMLVTRLNEGTAPHLYDLRTRTLAWKSDGAHVTTFWPK